MCTILLPLFLLFSVFLCKNQHPLNPASSVVWTHDLLIMRKRKVQTSLPLPLDYGPLPFNSTILKMSFQWRNTIPTQCSVANPVIPITSNADCSIVTNRHISMHCPLLEIDIPLILILHIKDNKVIYKVSTETGLVAR